MVFIIDDVVSTVVQTLHDLVVAEAKLLIGLGDSLEQFKSDIDTIQSFLEDAERWSDHYNQASLRQWVAELEELGEKAEDVLLRHNHQVRLNSRRRRHFLRFFKGCFCTTLSMHQAGNDIMSIRAQLASLSAKSATFSRGEGSSSSAPAVNYDHRLALKSDSDRHFTGREGDIEKVVSMVCESPLVLIWGMGGLGKTSLARKVFNHQDLKDRFEIRVWYCVTHKFNPENVLRFILDKFLPRGDSQQISELHELLDKLNECLMEKKCLIVLDDMWETRHWDAIKSAFPTENNKACKIILTSRYQQLISPNDGHVHRLGALTQDEGWELMRKIVIDEQGAEVETSLLSGLESIGRDIVKKCSCVPLAISVVAGSLRQKQITPGEWVAVYDKIDSYLQRQEGGGVGENTRVKQILDLSFESLPFNLRKCFMSLGSFPDYKEINLRELYLMWITEGLISSNERGNNESIKDVGDRYWNELVFRSMVQYSDEVGEAEKRSYGLLHDLMHTLCVSKGEGKKFIRLIDGRQPKRSSYPPLGSISRLAITDFDGDMGDYLIEREDELEGLRFLRLERTKCADENPKIHSRGCLTIFGKLKHLRTIILRGFELEDNTLPLGISKLAALKHLALCGLEVKELPKSMGDSTNLQILHLETYGTLRVHNVLHKMTGLKHLILESFISVVGGEKLILEGLDLETLHGFDSRFFYVEDINKLRSLEDLSASIYDYCSLSSIVDCMSGDLCPFLKTDLIVYFEEWDLSSEGGVDTLMKMLGVRSLTNLFFSGNFNCTFPSYQLGMCRNLMSFTFNKCADIQGNVMETLGKFPMLDSLYFLENEGVTEIIFPPTSFPSLTLLGISHLSDLEKLVVGEGAMPDLHAFSINDCFKLEMVPDLRNNTALSNFKVVQMPKEFNDRMRVVNGVQGPDFHKVNHIPFLELVDFSTPEDNVSPFPEDDEAQ